MPYSAELVARHLLWFESKKGEDADMTNLKLQKLLYYVQGFHLAMTGEPCFGEPVMAWQHGPVVASVYEKYKCNGSNPIPLPESAPGEIDEDTVAIIEEVATVYGQYAAWRLRDMTHEEKPWLDTPRLTEIKQEIMADFFQVYVKE